MASGPRGETVLVTGGSGFLGGWCLVELLRRGFRTRATIRDLSREPDLRAAIATEQDPGDRLAVHAADLMSDEGWEPAVEGCDYVLHVASPFPSAQPKDPDELVVPAREGTLRVLRAALAAGAKRVVVTSSIAAVNNRRGPREGPFTEEDWSDLDLPLTPYERSKTVAERSAWELAEQAGARDRLTVVNPATIIGPVRSDDLSFSLEVIERLLKGMPGIPRIGFSFVDVRDVAALEVTAMSAPEAAGERFIATGPFLWFSEVAAILRERLGEDARKVPERTLPDLLVRGMALFDPGVRSVVGRLGRRSEHSNEKARSRLGWTPRPIEETIEDSARSLIERGLVPS